MRVAHYKYKLVIDVQSTLSSNECGKTLISKDLVAHYQSTVVYPHTASIYRCMDQFGVSVGLIITVQTDPEG